MTLPHIPPTLRVRSALIILLYGGSLLSISLGGEARVLTYHEVLFAQPAREMLATGDWIIPRILGVPDTHKPPLTSWLIALSMWLTGSDAEWAVRLPGVLSALLTALMVAAFTARWFGDRVGLWAGLMQITMYYTMTLARLAEVDTLLVMTVAAAMMLFALAQVDSPAGRRSDRWLPSAFYLAVDLAFLAKGLIGLAFIFSGMGMYVLVRRSSTALRFLFNPIGLLIFVCGTLAWPIAAYCMYPAYLDDQITHHLGRFRGLMGTSEPVHVYLYAVPLCMLPWTPLVVLGGWSLWQCRQGHPGEQPSLWTSLGWFILSWVLPGLALLTASAWRHKHYAAPLLPPLTALAAVGLARHLEWRKRSLVLTAVSTASVLAVGCGAAFTTLVLFRPRGWEAMCWLTVTGGLLLAAAIQLDYKRYHQAHLATVFAAVWLVAAGVFGWVMPHHDSYRGQVEFALEIRKCLPSNSPLLLVGLPEAQISYYLTAPLERIDNPDDLLLGARTLDECFVLAPDDVVEDLEQCGDLQLIGQYVRPASPDDRLNLGRWRWRNPPAPFE